MDIKITFNWLPVLGVLFTILAFYVPKFNEWFSNLDPAKKQLFMLGLLGAVTLAAVGGSLLGFLNIYSGPTWKEWVWYPLVDFVAAVIANAGAYKATNYLPTLGKSRGAEGPK